MYLNSLVILVNNLLQSFYFFACFVKLFLINPLFKNCFFFSLEDIIFNKDEFLIQQYAVCAFAMRIAYKNYKMKILFWLFCLKEMCNDER